MVLANQYLERPTLIARGAGMAAVTLEGLWHRGERPPAVAICAPHPLLGGSMDSPVVAELAWALTRQGHATLRFNYQGVGASGGPRREQDAALPDGPQPLESVHEEAEDASAALRHLAECVPHGRVALAGYSFGAAVALSVAARLPPRTPLILVAPPTRLLDFSSIATIDHPTLIAMPQSDQFADEASVSRLVGKNPVVRVETIDGADHYFARGLSELGHLAASWLESARSR